MDSGNLGNLPLSTDTQNLLTAINLPSGKTYHLHDGAAPFRFFIALKAALNEACTVTGTPSLFERPLEPLLEALRQCGAEITTDKNQVHIISGMKHFNPKPFEAAVSSQFASALMLVAPVFGGKKQLVFANKPSSFPYLIMTAELMREFGVPVTVNESGVIIGEGNYIARTEYNIEPDWSSAAFFFARVACIPGYRYLLTGLKPDSLQGDNKVIEFYNQLGVETEFREDGCYIFNNGLVNQQPVFELSNHPDIAPSLIAACSCLKIEAIFKGIDNLRFKESDRIAAMNDNLSATGAMLTTEDKHFRLNFSNTEIRPGATLTIRSFNDHRIVMSMALFIHTFNLSIDNADCVNKSFPGFWEEWLKTA